MEVPPDHGPGEKSTQPGPCHAAHNSTRDSGHRCRAKTNRDNSCTHNTADVTWNADRGRRALHPKVTFREGTLRDLMTVYDLGDIPIETTNSVLDRPLGRKDGKRGAVKT